MNGPEGWYEGETRELKLHGKKTPWTVKWDGEWWEFTHKGNRWGKLRHDGLEEIDTMCIGDGDWLFTWIEEVNDWYVSRAKGGNLPPGCAVEVKEGGMTYWVPGEGMPSWADKIVPR